MAKKKIDDAPVSDAAGAAPSPTVLVYVGPPGQTSPVFGALEPGSPYTTADATFATYLAAKHPDYWQLKPAKE